MSGPAPDGAMGKTITAANGKQYYIFGNTRIKITEHFPTSGKPMEELIIDLITHKIKGKVSGIH